MPQNESVQWEQSNDSLRRERVVMGIKETKALTDTIHERYNVR